MLLFALFFAPSSSFHLAPKTRVLVPSFAISAQQEVHAKGSVRATLDLLENAVQACDRNVELEELMSLKHTLLDHSEFIQKQISFYHDDVSEACDVEDFGCSGDEAELKALTKYIEELRSLQSQVDDHLSLVESRIAAP